VRVATPAVKPWIWALLAGAAAVAILHPDKMAFVVHFARWVAVLILMYACFVFYNRLDKMTQVWLYPLLQFARSAAFSVIVPIEPCRRRRVGRTYAVPMGAVPDLPLEPRDFRAPA
jgi:hypothetical protein